MLICPEYMGFLKIKDPQVIFWLVSSLDWRSLATIIVWLVSSLDWRSLATIIFWLVSSLDWRGCFNTKSWSDANHGPMSAVLVGDDSW